MNGKVRVGLTGFGGTYKSDGSFAPFANETFKSVGDCKTCDKGGEISGYNISAGVTAGIGVLSVDAQVIEGHNQIAGVNKSNGDMSYVDDKSPVQLDPKVSLSLPFGNNDDSTSQTSDNTNKKGKSTIGFNIDASLNVEFGKLVPWSEVNSDVKSQRD